MYKIWAITRRELLETVKNPSGLVFTLALPIVLIALIGQIFTFSSSSDTAFKADVGLVAQDNGQAAQNFVTALKSVPVFNIIETDQATAEDRINNKRDLSAYIVIPQGFGQSLQSGSASVRAVIDPTDNSRYQIVNGTLQSVAERYNQMALLQSVSAMQAQQSGGKPLSAAELAQLQSQQKPVLSVKAENAGSKKFNQFDQVAPGYATMFVIFGLNTVALTLIEERQRGTLRRLATMPLPKWAYMLGKMLAQFIISFVQVAVMLIFARVVFNANIGPDNVLGIFLIVVALSFAATGLGMLIASAFSSATAVRPVVTLVALVGSALGGAWFPLFLMPQWVQTLSKVTINSWAMQGFNDLMIFNAGVGQVLLNTAVLLAYGAVCLLLAMRLFKYRAA